MAAKAAGSGPTAAAQAGAALLVAGAATYAGSPVLKEELYGPATVLVRCRDRDEVLAFARGLEGHLTATVHGTEADLAGCGELLAILRRKVGRLVVNGFPTGVEVCHAMQHGGPYPATTDPRSTSVGSAAIARFARPVCFQDVPEAHLPEELKAANPRGVWRLVDGRLGQDPL